MSPVYDRLRPLLTAVVASDRLAVSRRELQCKATKSIQYGRRCSYEPPAPVGPSPVPSALGRFHRLLEAPRQSVYELSDVALVGQDLLAITPQHRYVVEETNAKPKMLTDAVARTLYRGTLPVRRDGGRRFRRPVVSLSGVQSRAYFHWFADYLPRVRGVERYAEATGEYPDVLVPADPPAWMEESIQCIGIPDERLLRWDGGRATAERLVVPTVPREAADLSHVNFNPRELQWVGERIRSRVDPGTGEPRRILITRRGATTRRFVNEDELMRVLSPLGFEAVKLTQLSFEDQVSLFANAEAVVAPHGAGLINTIYATDVKILEIFGEFVSPLYYCIAGGLGFPYRYEQATDTQPTADSSGISVPGDDLVVDADRIQASLREWLDGEV
jgi:capsular polysaccharide biosynthesis protein